MNNNIKAENNRLPKACTLADKDQIKLQTTIAEELFTNFQQSRELNDGYALSYPGNDHWAAKLTEFIIFERKCCRFFTFELEFEPNEGPIWFRLRGPDGVKDFVKNYATNKFPSIQLRE
jgi:hypothetical protein